MSFANVCWVAISETMAQELSSFGIRTLIVDPGTFRTNFLSGDAVSAVEPSEPYKAPHVVTAVMESERAKHGKQLGDPEKAVKIIHDVVIGKDANLAKVLRLPLGGDCWEVVTAHMDQVRKDFDVCKDVAYSTKFIE